MKKKYPQTTLYSSFDTEKEYVEMLEAAIEKSGIGCLIADASGKVIKVNPAHIHTTGQSASYNLGRNMHDVQIEDGSPSATVIVSETKESVILEQHLVNGRSYLVYCNPYFGENQELKYIISSLLDTTEINNTKKSLEKIQDDNKLLSIQLTELQNQMKPQNKIIHQSRVMRQVLLLCDKVSQFDSNVLLQGESGVGKEKVAEYIFERSGRCKNPFIKINCASIPGQLLESELFGYEGGAFSGADAKGKKGLLEFADKGTLLLDEVSELELSLQAKLLRFLQEGEFYRVGGRKPIQTDVRIIAASNKRLDQMVKEKMFREDLYYRLHVIPITIPPLRERKEDIPLLVGHFTRLFNEKHNLKKTWDMNAINALLKFSFQGNVRELQNIIERILVLSDSDNIHEDQVENIGLGLNIEEPPMGDASLKEMLQNHEKRILKKYLSEYKTEESMASALKTSQSTISRKLIAYKIKEDFSK